MLLIIIFNNGAKTKGILNNFLTVFRKTTVFLKKNNVWLESKRMELKLIIENRLIYLNPKFEKITK